MSKYTTVKIISSDDCYGGKSYSVADMDGLIYRDQIGSYDIARNVADQMELRNTDQQYAGWGGLELS